MDYKLVYITYLLDENEDPIIYLFSRDREGNRYIHTVSDFKPYFYLAKNDTKTLPLIENMEISPTDKTTTIFGDPVIKISFKNPKILKRVRDLIRARVYEGDIPFVKVFMKDRDIISCYTVTENGEIRGIDRDVRVDLRKMYLDIEVLSIEETKIDAREARYPIGVIGLYDSYTREYRIFYLDRDVKIDRENTVLISCRDERDLLESFISYVSDNCPDVITGWFITRFDLPYIIKRCKKLDVDYSRLSPLNIVKMRRRGNRYRIKILGVNVIDLNELYLDKQETMVESMSLEYIAEREQIGRKIEIDNTFASVYDTDPSRIIERNIVDVELTVKLDEKYYLIDDLDETRSLPMFGVPIEDALSTSKLADMCFLRYCKNMNIVLPNKSHIRKKRYTGGLVLDPIAGIYRNILVLDYKSLYPSIILEYNISLDTYSRLGDIVVDNRNRFVSDRKGIIPQVVENILSLRESKQRELEEAIHRGDIERAKLLDRQQTLLKIKANALYGIFGLPSFRLYSPRIAEIITNLGRRFLQELIDLIRDMNYTVIYGDTDSVFVQLKTSDLIEEAKILESSINNILRNRYRHAYVKSEMIFSSLLLIAKKHYAGRLIYKKGEYTEEWYYRGMGIRRSDNSPVFKECQERVIQMILSDSDREEISSYLKTVRDNILSGVYDFSDLGIPSSIRKEIDQYNRRCVCKSDMIFDEEMCIFWCPRCKRQSKPSSSIRAVWYSNRYLNTRFGEGDKPRRIYINSVPVGYPDTDVIAFDENTRIPSGFSIDYSKMLDLLRKKIEPILRVYDPSLLLSLDKSRQSSLLEVL